MALNKIIITTNTKNSSYFSPTGDNPQRGTSTHLSTLKYLNAQMECIKTITPDSDSNTLLESAKQIYDCFNNDLGKFGWLKRLFGIVQKFFGYESNILNVDAEYAKITSTFSRRLDELHKHAESNALKFKDHISQEKVGDTVSAIIDVNSGEMEFVNRPMDICEECKPQLNFLLDTISKKQSSYLLHPCIIILSKDFNNYYRRISNDSAEYKFDLNPRVLIAYPDRNSNSRGTHWDRPQTEPIKTFALKFEACIKKIIDLKANASGLFV